MRGGLYIYIYDLSFFGYFLSLNVGGGNINYRKIYKERVLLIRMGKKQVMISIDESLHEKAKEHGNFSELVERSVRHKLEVKDVEIPMNDQEKCFDCKREQRKATRDNLDGLNWLFPDEVWICNSCLNRRAARIAI